MSITGSEQWMYSSGAEFYDFPIEQSLRTASGYLTRTFASAGDSKKMTISLWVKRANLDTGKQHFLLRSVVSTYDAFWIQTDYKLRLVLDSFNAYGITWDGLMRDTSAWYHIVLAIDTTQATPANRFRCFRNGEELTYTGTVPPQNYNLANFNKAVQHGISYEPNGGFIDGYIAEYNFIDGTAYDASYFGELKSGIWVPKDPTGLTYGTNGFRLNFADTVEASGFNTLTWTGDAANPKSVNGCGFSPDFVWAKARSSAFWHRLYDSVRGANKALFSNATSAETTDAAGEVTSFDSDGFTFSGSTNNSNLNNNGTTYVAWCWDAGSGSPVSNTDGSITSTVKANTDYGFSIVSYTGTGANATVGHGLTTAPELIFVRNRSGGDFKVYSEAVGNTYQGFLNDPSAFQNTGATIWNNTSPTSSVFSLGTNLGVNQSGANLIAYAFHSVTGYSKISTYTGTGVSGLSVTGLGFKPAFLMVKSSTAAEGWQILDNTREVAPDEKQDLLFANLSNAEVAMSGNVEFTDDGFNVNTTIGNFNTSGQTYLFMAFKDTRDAAFWRDVSGQGNDWQPNNLTFSDVVPDAPSNNFATMMSTSDFGGFTFSEGNLKIVTNHPGNNLGTACSFNLPTSGKWYWENRISISNSTDARNGQVISNKDPNITSEGTEYVHINCHTTSIYVVGATKNSDLNAAVRTGGGGILTFAYDADNNQLWVKKDASPDTGTTANVTGLDNDGNLKYMIIEGSGSVTGTNILNFGQDSTFAGARAAGGNADENGYGDFAYAPPSGFLSLCSANLPTGAIDTLNDETPEDYFNTVLYTGDGSYPRSVTNVGFQPDFVWAKARNASHWHVLYDVVRGTGTDALYTNSTVAEGGAGNYTNLTSFDSDGFSIGSTSLLNILNNSGDTFAAWNWKAGGAGVSNTDGSITSTVSVSETSQGNKWFSVVGFTTQAGGYTVGHGLGQKPSLVITKNRSQASAWYTFTDIIDGSVDYLALEQTTAKLNDPFGMANPTSSVFSLDDDYIFGSGDCVAYCFANAEGLCKVGSYTGNGSTDGSFIYTGFRPAFVMVKRTDSANMWLMMDDKRYTYNVMGVGLRADTSGAEFGWNPSKDFLSNGFKVRTADGAENASGGSYIFLAIAEQPFKYANAR